MANYVELKLSSLTFPISDKWSDAEAPATPPSRNSAVAATSQAKSMYYVRARVCGVAVTSTVAGLRSDALVASGNKTPDQILPHC